MPETKIETASPEFGPSDTEVRFFDPSVIADDPIRHAQNDLDPKRVEWIRGNIEEKGFRKDEPIIVFYREGTADLQLHADRHHTLAACVILKDAGLLTTVPCLIVSPPTAVESINRATDKNTEKGDTDTGRRLASAWQPIMGLKEATSKDDQSPEDILEILNGVFGENRVAPPGNSFFSIFSDNPFVKMGGGLPKDTAVNKAACFGKNDIARLIGCNSKDAQRVFRPLALVHDDIVPLSLLRGLFRDDVVATVNAFQLHELKTVTDKKKALKALEAIKAGREANESKEVMKELSQKLRVALKVTEKEVKATLSVTNALTALTALLTFATVSADEEAIDEDLLKKATACLKELDKLRKARVAKAQKLDS